MKTVLNTLKEKLSVLGYNENIINSILNKFDFGLIENQISENDDIEDYIDITEYEEPTVEIIQLFLNIKYDVLKAEVLEGDITLSSTETALGTRFAIADYSLYKRSAVIAMLNNFKIKIIIYKPNSKIQNIYNGIKYEQNFKKDRDEITKEYYDAFVANGRVPERKIREILTMLVADYVIDELAVTNVNPRIKMYDNEFKYAENLYSYSLRYINLKNNHIELLSKNTPVKQKSKSVQLGMITNDPYLKLDELPSEVDFPLNTISYYWLFSNKNKQEEIAIFVAPKTYQYASFSDLKKSDAKLEELAREISRKIRMDSSESIDLEYIKSVLQKLNFELMFPSIEIIRENLVNKMDGFEPIKYNFKVVTDPAEFEEKLYITIEDNVSRRYKYKLIENILEDLTTIGNKLEYTDESGTLVRKQSVADFNVNAPAAVIRRETFIDVSRIPNLLGYIYEDMQNYGTDTLPIPTIEVDFYIPKDVENKTAVTMYNGTSLDFSIDNLSKQNFFNSDGVNNQNSSYIIGGSVLPGSTYVTIRYVNSKGEILKENKVGNVFPRTTFLPEVIPTINDKDGKEWVFENKEVAPFIINENPSLNNIELKYVEKFARVTFSYINRDGKKIAEDKQEIVQVGTNYDFSSKGVYHDNNDDDWKLLFSRPSKLMVKDSEDKNKVILVYDIEKSDVVIKYLTKSGTVIAEEKHLQAAVDKVYRAEKIPYIVDKTGLGWNYIEASDATVLVKKDEVNFIDLIYEEAKRKVITRIKNIAGVNLKDEKVEYIQIGRKYETSFEKDITDYSCREWILDKSIKNEIIVSEKEGENVLEAIYKPRLAKVEIKLLNVDGRPIKDSLIEESQVGEMYNSDSKKEIIDNFGKVWTCAEKSEGIIISTKESQNIVTLKYKPLVSKVTVKYYDAEMNELLEPKYEEIQVGTEYKNVPIKKMTDSTGKKWHLDESKLPSIVVKKHEEENIVSIFYDKETTKVKLTFFDAFNNELREAQIIDSQIGAPLENEMYIKITDSHGGRWMLENSEPKNLTIRDGENSFKLIYGEIKAKVLVKHIAVKTQKTFVEDIISSVKLGGIFVPNIRQTILDKNKYKWKYIGEENISIVTKENEQENIILLTYDEDTSKVILKYRNEKDEKIREDAVKDVQIGKEIKIEPILKFNDNNGLGWKYVSSSSDTKIVKEEDNIITNHYEPLNSEIIIRFINDKEEDIISSKKVVMQVGKKFVPEMVEKIADINGHMWKFNSISEEEIIVKEEKNEIVYKYEKLFSDITIRYIDEEQNLIAEPIIEKIQVGVNYEAKINNNFEDKEGKAWLFKNISANKIKVSEDKEENIINITYKKELVDVKLLFFGAAMENIKQSEIVREQIGSIFVATPHKTIIDENKLGWMLREDLIPKYKVKRNASENIVNISYDKYLVDVAVEFKNDDNEKIIKDNITKHQVGTTFMPKVEDYIEDEEGKEWIHALKIENKFFSSGKKVEPIVVSQAEEKNIVSLHYKPSMIKVVVRYNDPLGAEIKSHLETEAQIGSNYTPEIIEKIVGNGNVKWMFNPNSKSTIKISRDEEKNIVNLAYEEQKAFVVYRYKDEYNNELKKPKKILAQIGSIYRPEVENVVEGTDGRVWEYKAKSIDEIKVDDEEKNNIVEVVYIPLKVNVLLKFATAKDKVIVKDRIIKAQLGSNFKPNIDNQIADEESKVFKFVKCEPESIKVKEKSIGSNEEVNIFKLTYEALYSNAYIVFKDVDGNKLKDDEVKQLQVGSIFAPNLIQYVTDKKGIQWELITEKIEPIRVKENEKENVITMVYEVAKAEISVRYKDLDGNMIKESDISYLEIGKEFIPVIEKEITDSKGRKWVYSVADPIKLTVGSINNIINVIYQEKKAIVVVKYQTTDGKPLKDDLKAKVQIGSKYEPQATSKVIYDENDIWRFAYNSPSDIIVSEKAEENVIIQYYTNGNDIEKTNVNKAYYNPEAEKFIDQKLVEEVEKEEKAKLEIKQEEERKKNEEMIQSQIVKFEDEHLQKLERNIKLTNEQKNTINLLNDYNTKIVQTLHEALEFNGTIEEYKLDEKLNNIIREEKKLVSDGLKEIIDEDKTGNKILQIFEAIISSELTDPEFAFLQRKKAILFADYFVNKNVADIEEATYIVERGKTESGIMCINEKINNAKTPSKDLTIIKVILIYEKVMLDNYYRARTIVKDNYFKDEASKASTEREVMVLVTNMLPNQAGRLFNKANSLSVSQRNELDAIMKLLNPQQLNTVSNLINQIPDNKLKKIALKLYKEIVG